MGLQVLRAKNRKNTLILTIMAIFALVLQPMYGGMAQQVASALAVNHVVINEIAPAGANKGEKWVELYNPTEARIDIKNWRLTRGTTNVGPVIGTSSSTYIEPNSFYVHYVNNGSLPLDGGTTPLILKDGNKGNEVDSVRYKVTQVGEKYEALGKLYLDGTAR